MDLCSLERSVAEPESLLEVSLVATGLESLEQQCIQSTENRYCVRLRWQHCIDCLTSDINSLCKVRGLLGLLRLVKPKVAHSGEQVSIVSMLRSKRCQLLFPDPDVLLEQENREHARVFH